MNVDSNVSQVPITKPPLISPKDAFFGGLMFALGDIIAAVASENFGIIRLLVVTALGATLYAIEIPHFFAWISRILPRKSFWHSIGRASLAVAFFNPIWIWRHFLLIQLSLGFAHETQWIDLLYSALTSFVIGLPLSFIGNWIIQNPVPLQWRFVASSVFSALMAFYYAMSVKWFG